MNWDAIGAIGEVLGAAGVIVSLVYVASQVRQNTIALRSAAGDAAAQAMRQLTQAFLNDPKMAGLIARGIENPEACDDDERAFLITFTFNLFRQWEVLHFQYESGTVDHETFHAYNAYLTTYLASPLLLDYWPQRRHFFTPRYQSFIDLMAETLPSHARMQRVARHMGKTAAVE